MTNSHTGKLEEDSPGLLRTLKSFLSPAEIQEFSTAFKLVIDRGGNTENGLEREDGVNYNPRPARVCEILIKECKEIRLEVLLAALYSCAKNCKEKEEINKENSVCIALAITLDNLRHLHMTDLDDSQVKLELSLARGLVNSADEITTANRLSTMVRSSLDRFAKTNT
ncbi:MAG: hypothetical protein R3A13_07835 [Bdellovibrionota bacterium]